MVVTEPICGAGFYACVCHLAPHGLEVAHLCGEPSPLGECGGSWFDPRDGQDARIVAYPPLGPLPFFTSGVRRGGIKWPDSSEETGS